MRDLSNLFNLLVPAALQKNAALPAVPRLLAFDDMGDFVEERQRIQRRLDVIKTAAPQVDYSDFSNHVSFDSAQSKFSIAQNRIINSYPFNGSSQEKDLYQISGSRYESYVVSQWPKSVGFVQGTGTPYITASDTSSKLYVGQSCSLYVSARISPSLPSVTYNVLSVLSGSSIGAYYGYSLMASSNAFTFRVNSGALQYDYTANYPTSSIQNKFATIAAMYDANAQQISLFLDGSKKYTAALNMGNRLVFGPARVTVGQNFSGAIGEIRVMHTASELFHYKNYSRPITSEDYVKLNYRFNEGVTSSSLDQTIVDYSKSALHGKVVNFTGSYRRSGSTALTDPGDLILYPNHPDVLAYCNAQNDAAQIFDATNRNSIFRLIPSDLLEDDQNATGLLTSFALAMARYFDDLKTYLDQFDNLRITNYEDDNHTPDIMLPLLKKYFGWKVTDHFGDSDPLQFLFGENVKRDAPLDLSLMEIRNQFWKRIMNNLPYLYKSKGKRNNIDSFLNVLGINSNVVSLKEFGSLKQSTITDDYIVKQKPMSFIGLSGGYAQTPSVFMSASGLTAEVTSLLPMGQSGGDLFSVASSGSLLAVKWLGSGSNAQVTLSGALSYTTPYLPLCNNVFTHFSVKSDGQNTTLEVRQAQSGYLTTDYAALVTGAFAYSGSMTAQFGGVSSSGYFGQARLWNRVLSDTDLDAHAYNPENIADNYAVKSGSSLVLHYALNENKTIPSTGSVSLLDLSRRGFSGTLIGAAPNTNPYKTFPVTYSFLSPTFDLKWTQNKIRIRNKSKLDISELGNDTNQVALEFNLVDALNEDIAKIFSSFTSMNNILGNPVNKYRSEYVTLEAYRNFYFDRLTDSLNFNRFFKLFRWFDKKIAQSIQQLLPARVNFIGGEFVVDSHALERNKYQYQYPIFHTPKDIGEGNVSVMKVGGSSQTFITASLPLMGTSVSTRQQSRRSTTPRYASVDIEAALMPRFKNVMSYDNALRWQNLGNSLPSSAASFSAYGDPGVSVGVDPQGNITGSNNTGNTARIFIRYTGLTPGMTVPLSFTPNSDQGQSFSSFDVISPNTDGLTILSVTSTNTNAYQLTGSADSNGVCSASFDFPAGKRLYLRNISPARFATIPKPVFSYVSTNNDPDAIEYANSSINYRDEYVRRIEDRRLAAASGRVINPYVNNRSQWLANGFVFGDINSRPVYPSSPLAKGNLNAMTGTYYPWQGNNMGVGLISGTQPFSPAYGQLQIGATGRLYGFDNTIGNYFCTSLDYGKTLERTTVLPSYMKSCAWNMNATETYVWACSSDYRAANSSSTVYSFMASTDGGVTFSTVYSPTSSNTSYGNCVAVRAFNKNLYVLTTNYLYKSFNYGLDTYSAGYYSATDIGLPSDMQLGPAGEIYILDIARGLIKSTNQGSSFIPVLSSSLVFLGGGGALTVCPNGMVYVAGASTSNNAIPLIFSSSTGNNGTFTSKQALPTSTSTTFGCTLASDPSNNVYYGISPPGGSARPWDIWATYNNGNSWSQIDSVRTNIGGGTDYTLLANVNVGKNGEIFSTGYFNPTDTANYTYYIHHAKPVNNSSLAGPMTLATSFNTYIGSSSVPTLVLGNVSEYPHFGGLYQMRNLVLGTRDYGRIGTDDTNIVQIRHIGSVVNVMWPDQSVLDAPVPGFGELSIGQSPGKAGTVFTYGRPFDTTQYNHVSLYCYAQKQLLGTPDEMQIAIQRRPLTSVGFATDQIVAYDSSSANYTAARYSDIYHVKAINYSDLSTTLVSYVIDVPLVNVKEIRIGVRQKNGQADGNKNFLVWGRFIDTDKET